MYDRQLGKGCPVNCLPTELLAHIFYLGTRDDDLVSFPVLASHVCRLWRNVALGSPSLWTTITFSDHPPYKRSQVWIERSKSLPIEIIFDVTYPCWRTVDETLSDVSTILDIIVPQVTRWRKLEVFVDEDVFMDNVVTRLAQCASAPLLEILSLRNPGSSTPRSSLVPFHGNAPRLSYVILRNVSIGWSSSLLHDLVEFELDLTSVEIDMRPSWVDLSRILRDSPRLTYLELFHSSPADWQNQPIDLLMPSLEHLSLMDNDPIYISSLFRLLSMPNLKKLSLELYGDDYGDDYSEFVRQLATPPRSVLSRLRYLKIFDLSCHPGTITVMYEQLTNLRSIYLDYGFVHKSFFTTLMKSLSGALYCPNLTKIITSGISGKEMRSFITARAMGGIPIKQIAMWKGDDLNEEDERWLRENVRSFHRFDKVYFES